MTREETKTKDTNTIKQLKEKFRKFCEHNFGDELYEIRMYQEFSTFDQLFNFIESEIIEPYEKQLEQVEKEKKELESTIEAMEYDLLLEKP